MNLRRLAPAVAAVACLSVSSGCSMQTVSVDGDTLSKTLSSRLADKVGQAPDEVTCPDDLEGKVGATTRCTLTAGDDTLGVNVKVTKVDGKNVDFDFEVDEMPAGQSTQ